MLKGAVIAFGIMLGAIAIPGFHWVTVWFGPFVAGYFGGGIAKADEDKIVKFGLLVAGMMLVPVAAALSALYIFDVGGILRFFLFVMAIVIVPYTWFGVTLGALFSYLSRKKAAEKAAAEEANAASS
jgi:fatty acid desaturase